MDKQAFKERMKSLKSYREQNPDKGYWDWKVQAFDGGGGVKEESEKPNKNPDYRALQREFAIEQGYDPNTDFDTWLKKREKEYNKKFKYERAAHHSSGGDFYNVVSYILNSNEDNVPYYTGSYIKGKGVSKGEISYLQGGESVGNFPNQDFVPNKQRDLIKNFIYGEDFGFEKSKEPVIVINGKSYPQKQYEGYIAPYDTIHLPLSMKNDIDSIVANKLVFSMKHNTNYVAPQKILNEGYNVDNTGPHSGTIKKKGQNYYTTLFDLWDFAGNYPYGLDWIAHQFQKKAGSNKFFKNAGPFVLRQNIPIKFIEDKDYQFGDEHYSGYSFLKNVDAGYDDINGYDSTPNKTSVLLYDHFKKLSEKFGRE